LGQYTRGVSVLAPTSDGSMVHFHCARSDEDEAGDA
jgi:hypothetical protein